MKGYLYLKDRGSFDVYDDVEAVDIGQGLYDLTNDEMHIGQGYEGKPARIIKCLKCGGREFFVGSGNCFTAIGCVSCGLAFHEG